MPWLDSRRRVLETCKPSKMTQLEKGRDPAPTGFPSPPLSPPPTAAKRHHQAELASQGAVTNKG